MHRAKWLAEHATPEGKKVLVTTFTRNLAIDIETNLNTLCTRDIMSRIEVRNLDAWVLRFLRSKRYEQSIVYGRGRTRPPCAGILRSQSRTPLWGSTMSFMPPSSSRWCWRKA